MGGFFSKQSSLKARIVEEFIDELQENWLSQLAPNSSVRAWDSNTVFGTASSRTPEFTVFADLIRQPFISGLRTISLDPYEVSAGVKEYLISYLAHHIMRCLLCMSPDKLPAVELHGLEGVSGVLARPVIPSYENQSIQAFQEQWCQHQGKKISINTEQPNEQRLLSTFLAERIIRLIKQINLQEFVSNACQSYLNQMRALPVYEHIRTPRPIEQPRPAYHNSPAYRSALTMDLPYNLEETESELLFQT
jgi:hypothetical protein